MSKWIRRKYYQVYIIWLGFKWMFKTNLGDWVIYEGKSYQVCNGVVWGCWTLSDEDGNRIEQADRAKCKKIISIQNLAHDFKYCWYFYTSSWLEIWVNFGRRG